MSLTPNSSQEFVLPDAESDEALVELSSSNFFNILSPCSVENSCILEDIDLDLQCEEDEDVDSCLLEHFINRRNLPNIPCQDSNSPLTLFQPFNFASYQSSKVQSVTPTPSPDTEFRTSNDAASETKLAFTPSVLPHTRLESRPINNSWENLCVSSEPDKASPEIKHLHPRLCSIATSNDNNVKSDLKHPSFPSEVKPHSFDISNSAPLKLLISLKQTKGSEGKLGTLQPNKDSNSCDSKNEIKRSYSQKLPSTGIIECSDTSGHDVLLMCNECKISFSTTRALQSHNDDKHVVKKEHKWHTCWECGRAFKYEKVMKRHQQLHTLQKTEAKALTIYQCSKCTYSGKSEALLRAHAKSQHNPERTKYFCEKCEFSCLQEQTFSLHKLQHDGEGKFACDQCGKLFLSMGVLKRHAHTHSKVRPYICPWEACGKAFTMRGRLTDHMRRVHEQGDKPAKLDNCDYDDKRRVESKLAVEGTGSGNKMCCPNKELDRNLGEVFEKSKNASIKTGKADVVVHDIILPRELLATFSATKPVCKRRKENFLNSQILEEDVDLEIPTRKKFTCSWEKCGKTFRDNFNLRLHMCTHTGEMQKACPLCRYRCVQKSALDSHMKTHVRNRKRKTKL